ncbi:kinase and exchange factor for Rac A-like isoform X11 [Zophobas morio]|uniref:kinase and exchange factor for Rac A-like isoform X11 n=1 Tax=Zophobas morio TaxID=2755281 RepID=UPI003083BCF5
MVEHEDQIGFLIVVVVLVTLILGIRKYLQFKKKLLKMNIQERHAANQQEDIFNISSRVQGQGQWPTHDAHVSLDHFAITNEINKYNDDPPTYEEAMNIAASNNNNTVVPAVVPKTTITPSSTTTTTTTTSTSTSAAN